VLVQENKEDHFTEQKNLNNSMSRRRAATKREILPDHKFKDTILTKFMNRIMLQGKKSVAEQTVYGALDLVEEKTKKKPIDFFHEALENVKPSLEVRSRRVGGATYQVPMEVRPKRAQALAMKWIVTSATKRNEKTMKERVANELIDAFNNKGNSVKKREETHKMAESNRAFSHFRW
jgi:small subunit ribosomal protein S7